MIYVSSVSCDLYQVKLDIWSVFVQTNHICALEIHVCFNRKYLNLIRQFDWHSYIATYKTHSESIIKISSEIFARVFTIVNCLYTYICMTDSIFDVERFFYKHVFQFANTPRERTALKRFYITDILYSKFSLKLQWNESFRIIYFLFVSCVCQLTAVAFISGLTRESILCCY